MAMSLAGCLPLNLFLITMGCLQVRCPIAFSRHVTCRATSVALAGRPSSMTRVPYGCEGCALRTIKLRIWRRARLVWRLHVYKAWFQLRTFFGSAAFATALCMPAFDLSGAVGTSLDVADVCWAFSFTCGASFIISGDGSFPRARCAASQRVTVCGDGSTYLALAAILIGVAVAPLIAEPIVALLICPHTDGARLFRVIAAARACM